MLAIAGRTSGARTALSAIKLRATSPAPGAKQIRKRRKSEISRIEQRPIRYGAKISSAIAIPRRNPSPGGSEEHTSELQSLMRISYAVFCLKTKHNKPQQPHK